MAMSAGRQGDFMRRAVFVAMAFVVAACSPEGDQAGYVTSCAANLYRSYNPTVLDQCVSACMRCDHGTVATCSTSCTLKGAR
jgi:hypothetical protein